MKVLLDTNIVLDYLGANKGFTEDAEKVFDVAAKKKRHTVCILLCDYGHSVCAAKSSEGS